EGPKVGADEVRARRAPDGKADAGELADQEVPPGAIVREELPVIRLAGLGEGDRRAVLQRRRRRERDELMGGAHRARELGRSGGPSDLPSGPRKRVAARRDAD